MLHHLMNKPEAVISEVFGRLFLVEKVVRVVVQHRNIFGRSSFNHDAEMEILI